MSNWICPNNILSLSLSLFLPFYLCLSLFLPFSLFFFPSLVLFLFFLTFFLSSFVLPSYHLYECTRVFISVIIFRFILASVCKWTYFVVLISCRSKIFFYIVRCMALTPALLHSLSTKSSEYHWSSLIAHYGSPCCAWTIPGNISESTQLSWFSSWVCNISNLCLCISTAFL